MAPFGLLSSKPPDAHTLGKWLFLNDLRLLETLVRNSPVMLFKSLKEGAVIDRVATRPLERHERSLIAGYTTQLLDSGTLLPGYEPKPELTPELAQVAERTRDAVIADGPGPIYANALIAGTVFAIRAWFTDFDTSIAMSTYIIDLFGTPGAELYRVRGIGHFARGDYGRAKDDLEYAYQLDPNLVNIKQPLQSVQRLLARR